MIQDLASHGKVFNATGKFDAAASVSLTLPNPVGPDITLYDYKLGEYDIVNNEPPPPPPRRSAGRRGRDQPAHTLLDTSKMTRRRIGGDCRADSRLPGHRGERYLSRRRHPGRLSQRDRPVRRAKDDVNSDYYNLIGFNGPAPNDVAINIDDPFRVFADEGVPDPRPLRRSPAYC